VKEKKKKGARSAIIDVCVDLYQKNKLSEKTPVTQHKVMELVSGSQSVIAPIVADFRAITVGISRKEKLPASAIEALRQKHNDGGMSVNNRLKVMARLQAQNEVDPSTVSKFLTAGRSSSKAKPDELIRETKKSIEKFGEKWGGEKNVNSAITAAALFLEFIINNDIKTGPLLSALDSYLDDDSPINENNMKEAYIEVYKNTKITKSRFAKIISANTTSRASDIERKLQPFTPLLPNTRLAVTHRHLASSLLLNEIIKAGYDITKLHFSFTGEPIEYAEKPI
jgi:hypothetical protein